MTTAHRPTWKAAVGRGNEGGYGSTGIAVSHLDLASHTQLKHRAIIDKKAALKESLMKLEAAAAVHTKTTATLGRRTMNPMIEQEGRMKLLKQTEEVNVEQLSISFSVLWMLRPLLYKNPVYFCVWSFYFLLLVLTGMLFHSHRHETKSQGQVR